MIDLGNLYFFLGISVTRDPFDMFLSQWKYVLQILDSAHMLHCKHARTPADTSEKFDPSSTLVSNQTLYRRLFWDLQHLTFTRPNIVYVVHQVCPYMHDPREPHFTTLKRILWYIRGTINHGLQLYSSPAHVLIAYSNTDSAGCPITKRSTS